VTRGRGSGPRLVGMRAGSVCSSAGRHGPSGRYQVLVELTTRQVEMLLFFAKGQEMSTVRAQTSNALIRKGLIRRDEGSLVYRITELGQAIADVVADVVLKTDLGSTPTRTTGQSIGSK
jgi:hypothetical protein